MSSLFLVTATPGAEDRRGMFLTAVSPIEGIVSGLERRLRGKIEVDAIAVSNSGVLGLHARLRHMHLAGETNETKPLAR